MTPGSASRRVTGCTMEPPFSPVDQGDFFFFANSLDPDEKAYNKTSNQDLHGLPFCVFISV